MTGDLEVRRAPGQNALREALSPLREHDFRLLFVGRLVSVIGTAVAPVALVFAILDDLAGTAAQVGLVLSAMWIPQTVFVAIGGVFADRLPRHLVLVVSSVLSGAAQLAAAVVLLAGTAELWHLVACQVASGIAAAFFFPASTGIIPQSVTASQLQRANALLRLTTNGSFAIRGVSQLGRGEGRRWRRRSIVRNICQLEF